MSLFKEKTNAAEPAARQAGKRMRKGSVPTRTSINLVRKEKTSLHLNVLLPSLVLIIAAAVLISRFAVVNLLQELNRAQSRVRTDQQELDECYSAINGFGELTDKYAHYTTSGMNETELTAVSRQEILELLRDQVLPYADVESWSVSYNTVTLPITCSTLQDINQIVQKLNEDERVDFCTVTEAKTNEATDTYTTSTGNTDTDKNGKNTLVVHSATTTTAQVTIYLADEEKGAE